MSEQATIKANWYNRAFKRLEELELDKWLGFLFWIVVVWMFLTDPLSLYDNNMWWGYIVLSILLLLIVGLFGTTLTILGKIYFLIEARFEEYRRNELRRLFRESPYQLRSGVVMRDKWKELYEFLEQNISFTELYNRTQKYQDVELVRLDDGSMMEYAVTKWRTKGKYELEFEHLEDVDDTDQVDELERFIESGIETYSVPSPTRLILQGFWIATAIVGVIGVVLLANGLLNS